MRAKKIYESPEEISLPNLTYNWKGEAINHNEKKSPWLEDRDAYPFFIIDGNLVIGKRSDVHGMPAAEERSSGYYPGRIWLKRKLMSFWEYPDRDTFLEIMRKLEDHFSINILADSKWMVEIIESNSENNPWRSVSNDIIKTQLIPCREYARSSKRVESELSRRHTLSPLLKQKKGIHGFGSSHPKYMERRKWQMAAPLGESNNVDMKKLVAESLEELLEGVGDKYLERKYGIPDEISDFEDAFTRKTSGNSIGKAKGFDIIKNPKSLSGFPQGSRAVITKAGDLYVVADVANVIHTDILRELKNKGIVSFKSTGWEDPSETSGIDFITVQRVWTKPVFAIGESYFLPKAKYPEERAQALKFFEPFLEAARKKNPHFKFVNEQIRRVAKDILSAAEHEKFLHHGS